MCVGAGEPGGERLYEQADHRRGVAFALGVLGWVARCEGQVDEASAHLERGLAIALADDDVLEEGILRTRLARLYLDRGRSDRAAALLDRALTIARERRSLRAIGQALAGLGELRCQERRWDAARATLTEEEAVLRGFGDPISLADLLLVRAALEVDLGTSPEATLREVEAWMDAAGVRPESPIERGVAALRVRAVR